MTNAATKGSPATRTNNCAVSLVMGARWSRQFCALGLFIAVVKSLCVAIIVTGSRLALVVVKITIAVTIVSRVI